MLIQVGKSKILILTKEEAQNKEQINIGGWDIENIAGRSTLIVNEKALSAIKKINLCGGIFVKECDWMIVYIYEKTNVYGYINLSSGYVSHPIYSEIATTFLDVALVSIMINNKQYRTVISKHCKEEILNREPLEDYIQFGVNLDTVYLINHKEQFIQLANFKGERITLNGAISINLHNLARCYEAIVVNYDGLSYKIKLNKHLKIVSKEDLV